MFLNLIVVYVDNFLKYMVLFIRLRVLINFSKMGELRGNLDIFLILLGFLDFMFYYF